MELYIVKDKVEYVDLEKYNPAKMGHHNSDPSVGFMFQFPDLVKTVDQSRPGRDRGRVLAGKLKQVVKQFVKMDDTIFRLSLHRNSKKQEVYQVIIAFFGLSDEEGGDDWEMDLIFGKENFRLWMSVALCHLPTKDSPAKSDDLITLRGGYLDPKNRGYYCEGDKYKFIGDDKEEIEEVRKLLGHQTGWIYVRLTVGIELNEEAMEKVVGRVRPAVVLKKVVEQRRKMLEGEFWTDLEIVCGDGKIVRGHRGIVGASSRVFQAMLEAEGMEEKRTGRVEMEGMSEQGVRALLGWIYWREDKEALMDSGVAVELLIAGDKYEVEGLVKGMKEIILEGMGKEEEWFSVESALEFLGWAGVGLESEEEDKKELREKAVGVLKFFWENFREKFGESEEYQEWVNGNAETAKEWNSIQNN